MQASSAQAHAGSGLTVNSVGIAYCAPDTAVLDMGVSIYHAVVARGRAQTDRRMQAIREALVAARVDLSDIHMKYDWRVVVARAAEQGR